MKTFQLKFFMHENSKHQGRLLYEWLLEKAKEIKIPGGSIFRAIAGYGREGIIHEEHFFELAANVPVEAVFILTEEECANFLKTLAEEKLSLFYVKIPLECGILNKE